jgi:DNA-binding MarR family transcriptional regulator
MPERDRPRTQQRLPAARPRVRGTGAVPPTVEWPALLSGGSDRAFRRLIYDLHSFAVRLDRMRERISAFLSLTGSQYHILMVVAEHAGAPGLNVNGVAAALRTSGPYVTREAGALVRRGLLAKRGRDGDRRQVVLELTPAGRAAIDGIAPVLREINRELFRAVSAAEFGATRRFVGRFLANFAAAEATAARLAEGFRRGRGTGWRRRAGQSI